jgi:hypothetical protein
LERNGCDLIEVPSRNLPAGSEGNLGIVDIPVEIRTEHFRVQIKSVIPVSTSSEEIFNAQ